MKNIARKISFILIFCMVLTIINAGVVLAIQEVEFIPAKYSESNNPTINSNGTSLSLTSGKYAAYDVNFTDSPAYMILNIGTSEKYKSTIEVKLDNSILLGTITAGTGDVWHSEQYSIDINQEITGKHKIYIKSLGGTCDFNKITFVFNESKDVYPTFAEENVYTDIWDNAYKTEINLLHDLGIYTDGDEFVAEKLVTRRNFINALSGFYSQDLLSSVQAFNDVTQSDEDYKKFNMLYEQRILNPDKKGNINPNEFITLADACKMVLKVLELDFQAKDNSDTSYIQLAKRVGIISSNASVKTITNEQMTEMLYNAITCDYMDIIGVGEESFIYIKEPKSVLERTRDIKYGEGVVSSHGYTDIYSTDETADFGEVKIDGITYRDADGIAGKYIGFNCVFFYKELMDGSKDIVAIRPSVDVSYINLSSKDNEITKIQEDAIEYIDENNKEKELETNVETNFILNGKVIENSLDKYVDADSFKGTLLLIDNDGDKSYDTVFIENYVSVLFGGATEEYIYNKLTGENIPIDNKDDVLIYKNGSRVKWSDISEDTVFDFYQSQNSDSDKINRAIVQMNEAEGIVSKITSDGEIVINDIPYKKYNFFTKEIKPGQIVKAKLNSDNEIVDFKQTVELKIGYLLGISEIYDKGFEDGKLNAKLLTENNSIEEYEFNKNCVADGEKIKSINDLYNGKDLFKGMINISLETPVKYGINEENKIVFIDTVEKGKEDINDCLRLILGKGSYRRFSSVLISGEKVGSIFAKNMKVINLWSGGDEELYTITDSLDVSNDVSFTCATYSTNPDGITADLAIWYDRTANLSSKVVYADKVIKYEDEQEKIALKCYTGTSEVTYDVNRHAYDTNENFRKIIDSAQPGDILQFRLDDNKNIMEARICFLNNGAEKNAAGIIADTSILNTSGTWITKGGKVLVGKIEAKENGALEVSRIKNDVKEYEFLNCDSAAVVVVEPNEAKLRIINGLGLNDIVKGQTIVACQTASYSTSLIVVYNNIEF